MSVVNVREIVKLLSLSATVASAASHTIYYLTSFAMSLKVDGNDEP